MTLVLEASAPSFSRPGLNVGLAYPVAPEPTCWAELVADARYLIAAIHRADPAVDVATIGWRLFRVDHG